MLLLAAIISALTASAIAAGFPSLPSIKDEIFSFPQNGLQPPRIPLKYVNGVPTVPFSIGTPPQKFVGIFDTASPITWVMSKNCTSQACSLASDSDKFLPEKSATNSRFPFKLDLTYLDGTHVQLKPEFDVMTFGDLPIPPHLFGEAYQVDYPKGYFPPANARLGLGDFGSIDWTKVGLNVDTPQLPFGNIPKPFGKRASGDDRYSTGATSGSPSFRKRGPFSDSILESFAWVLGVDESLYTGPIYQLPIAPISGLLQSPFWNIPMVGFQLRMNSSSTALSNQNTNFSFQSGAYGKVYSSSPYLTIPTNLADSINKAIGATYNSDLNLYTTSCSAYSTGPSLVLQFGAGIDAEIPARQYIYQLEENDLKNTKNSDAKCYSAIVGSSTDNKNVFLGGPFFRSFYLTYQFSSQVVGIAESISKAGKVYKHI